MKRITLFFLTFTAIASPLRGEEVASSPTVAEDEASTLSTGTESASAETGTAASEAVKESSSGEWQNWVFAGSAAVALTVGVLIVSLNTGHSH